MRMPHEVDHTCPYCKSTRPNLWNLGDAAIAPSPGDFAHCHRCGCWSVFGPGLKLEHPTKEEAVELQEDVAVRHYNRLWKMYQGKMRVDRGM